MLQRKLFLVKCDTWSESWGTWELIMTLLWYTKVLRLGLQRRAGGWGWKGSFKDLFTFGPKPLSKMNQWIPGPWAFSFNFILHWKDLLLSRVQISYRKKGLGLHDSLRWLFTPQVKIRGIPSWDSQKMSKCSNTQKGGGEGQSFCSWTN